jgi:hypothetical protein
MADDVMPLDGWDYVELLLEAIERKHALRGSL